MELTLKVALEDFLPQLKTTETDLEDLRDWVKRFTSQPKPDMDADFFQRHVENGEPVNYPIDIDINACLVRLRALSESELNNQIPKLEEETEKLTRQYNEWKKEKLAQEKASSSA